MKLNKLLEQWDLTGLKIKAPFLEMEWAPMDADKAAAWELYVEMLTRIVTQPIVAGTGLERSALESVHQLFPLTRGILKSHGRDAVNFAKIAIVVLNQVVRPFTAKWHVLLDKGPLDDTAVAEFHAELTSLQAQLRNYARLLADLAGVEDLTALEG